MTLQLRDLEVINLELSTQIQEMDHAISNGKRYNEDTIKYLDEMRAALTRVRAALSVASGIRPRLQVVA